MRRTHLGAFLLGATLATAAAAGAGPRRVADRFQKLDVFARVLSHVESHYVDEVDEQKLVHGALKGMVRTLDPHSEFMTPEEFADLRADTDGEFGGIGVEVDEEDGVLVVVAPIPGSPAARAGLVARDRIVGVDGTSTKGRDPDETASRLRGAPATTVKLDIERKGWESPRTFVLKREIIHVDAVEAALLAPGMGYARIKQFQERTERELVVALDKLRVSSGGRLDGLILDLRDNPGGLLDESVKVADLFLSSGVVVTTVGRGGRKLEEEVARSHGPWEHVALACLVNGGTASAAEIVAGAIRDHERGILVGTQTFGKGSVQSVIEMDDGSGLKLTVARYLTPSKRSIQEEGIAPDLFVEELDPDLVEKAKVKESRERERDLEGHLPGAREGEQVGGKEQVGDGAQPTPVHLARDNQVMAAYQALKAWHRLQRHEPRGKHP
ncbi:MAG: S41 family peptidase [Deltaproteobacteria bacterium]|nr:S41 family peptidase [Deltaproteobacteria bacterium]